jgi:hypothetical protein
MKNDINIYHHSSSMQHYQCHASTSKQQLAKTCLLGWTVRAIAACMINDTVIKFHTKCRLLCYDYTHIYIYIYIYIYSHKYAYTYSHTPRVVYSSSVSSLLFFGFSTTCLSFSIVYNACSKWCAQLGLQAITALRTHSAANCYSHCYWHRSYYIASRQQAEKTTTNSCVTLARVTHKSTHCAYVCIKKQI